MTKFAPSLHYLERSEHLQAALDGHASAYASVMALASGPEPTHSVLCDAALAALSMDDHRSLLLLLQSGLDNHQRFSGGAPLLTLAAKAGRADCLSMLLERGTDATLRDDFSGSTPAHFAAHNGHIACLRSLAQSGYPLDEPCRSGGQTPLAQAASQSQLACVCFLIAQGARLDARNFAGEPIAFDCFKSSEPDSLDCARALYEAGAPLNSRDGKGRTALRALADPIPYAAHPPQEFVQLLLSLGADPNLSDAKGDAPLHACARRGASLMASDLLAAGANPSKPDAQGSLPHNIAERNIPISPKIAGTSDFVSMLLSAHEKKNLESLPDFGLDAPRVPRL